MSQREYAEDTVFWSLKRAAQFSARRRTLQLFFANSTPGQASTYTWIDNTAQLWRELTAVLEARVPGSIAVNVDDTVAFSSGMHFGEYLTVAERLGSVWASLFVSVPMLAVEFVASMPADRLGYYRSLQQTAWAIIDEGFSASVVSPGKTTTTDVEWWMRDKIQALNYTTWFQPSVSIIGPGARFGVAGLEAQTRNVIKHGDMLHVD